MINKFTIIFSLSFMFLPFEHHLCHAIVFSLNFYSEFAEDFEDEGEPRRKKNFSDADYEKVGIFPEIYLYYNAVLSLLLVSWEDTLPCNQLTSSSHCFVVLIPNYLKHFAYNCTFMK